MASGNTAYITYVLIPTGFTGGSYSQAIHCNYIKKIDLGITDPLIQEISLNFSNPDDFKFLSSSINNQTGYTVNQIHALVQVVDNTPFDSLEDVKPDSTKWKQHNITDQVTGYTSGSSFLLTGAELTSVVFKISLLQYNDTLIFIPYDLDYLNYPTKEVTDDDALCFGDESYFFGNVTTQIKAIAYTTDLSINLPLNEFNSSNNLTWNGDSVVITEIGIYDANKNLVGIGKLNNPILKDSSIARTIVFAIDF